MPSEHGGRSRVGARFHGLVLRASWGPVLFAGLGLGLLSLAMSQPATEPRREITLTAQSVPLSTSQPALDGVGRLKFRGGLWLQSLDPGFGGLSGLAVSDSSGELSILAVTDQGEKFTAKMALGDAALRIDSAVLEPLIGLDGLSVAGKAMGDAESLTRLPDGRILVGFERHHRVWAYGPDLNAPARVFETPAAFAKAPSNGGAESLANFADGRILAIMERPQTGDLRHRAFLHDRQQWTDLEWKASGEGFLPVDAAVMANGDLLVLERYFSAVSPMGLSSRIRRVRGDTVRPGAVLEGETLAELTSPLVAENFEGLATFRNAAGVTQIVIVSDNNFSPLQRTLLLWFELRD